MLAGAVHIGASLFGEEPISTRHATATVGYVKHDAFLYYLPCRQEVYFCVAVCVKPLGGASIMTVCLDKIKITSVLLLILPTTHATAANQQGGPFCPPTNHRPPPHQRQQAEQEQGQQAK